MKAKPLIRSLFGLAAVYDGALGIIFLFFAKAAFQRFEITLPNHFGYIHFPAALLIVYGIMYAAIAMDPDKNINLIPYGILLKVSYCGVILFHTLTGSIPWIWQPFAVFDFIFLVLFVISYVYLLRSPQDGK
ncbi:MAG: hypothetical protein JW912_04075 [Sedimentisphaerales bacterium]|nr:hypothetical protein [Sedimentisphaerales bacterium]